ncbi:glutaredoxin family protein [Tolumonas lignilytica]|uniref:glutaredoxin family protein n=1 Tax=Tolumonas lignilytica TaxID=1283284 RepID=UPI000467D847|nr:glutaredoxin [Tolumonas lignilytica]
MSFPAVVDLNRLALYIRPSCPFCVRVLDYCEQAGIKIENRNIAEGVHLEALMTGGGKRQVPCLRIVDDEHQSHWMYESMDIIAYLKQQFAV